MMPFCSTIFGQLLEHIDRRVFAAIVERHDGDRYYKGFDNWDHLVALLHGQFGGADSLRAIVEGFNASAPHHRHLVYGRLARSTFCDANAARDPRVFADVFAMLSRMLGSRDQRKGKAMTQIIGSTPIPLGALLYKARWQIELLFRWLKQHLKIRAFLGRNDHAIRLQLLAAMIAYAVLRLAVLANKIKRPLYRFGKLVETFLFEGRRVIAIEKPPPVHPCHARYKASPDQLSLCYD